MALPRYEGGNVPLGKSGAAMAAQAQANTIDSFVQNIQGIKRGAIQTIEQESINRAKEDAERAFTERGLAAEVNRDMTAYGQQYANTIESLHKKRVSIDTSKRFNELYETHKDNPAAFEAMSEGYRKTTLNEIPAHLKADFTIDFEANKAHYSGQVSSNAIAKTKEQDRNLTLQIVTDSNNKATQAMRDHNQTLAMHEMTKAINALEESYQNRNITLAERDKYIQSIYHDTSKANFKGVNDGYIQRDDLEGAQLNIDKFRHTKIDGFDDAQRERLADEMQSDLNREITKRKVDGVVSEKADNKVAKELIFLQDNGQEVEPDRLQSAMEGKASPEVKEQLLNSIKDYNEILLFNNNPNGLTGQREKLDEMRTKQNKTEDDYRLEVKMRKAFDKAQKDIKEDGLTYSVGKVFDEVGEVDINTWDADSVGGRTRNAQLATTLTGTQQPFFTKPEIDSLKLSLPDMTSSEKASLASKINSIDDDGVKYATFNKLGGMFAIAGTHINPDVSRRIFEGEQLMKDKLYSSKPTISASIRNTIIVPLEAMEDAGILSDQVRSVEAYIASQARETGKDIEDISIDEAIENVVGEIYEPNWYGGSIKTKTLAPFPGVTEDKFLDWKENLKREDIIGGGGARLTLEKADMLKNGDFIFAGNGKYMVRIGTSIQTYKDENGQEQPYLYKYPKGEK